MTTARSGDFEVPVRYEARRRPNYGTYAGSTTKTEITVTSNVTVKDASRYGYSFDGWYVTKDRCGCLLPSPLLE